LQNFASKALSINSSLRIMKASTSIFGLSIVMVCALSACGGGGDDGGASPTPLSETQRLFLENSQTSSGGVFNLNAGWTTTGVNTTLNWAQVTKVELPKSPAGINGGVTGATTVGIQLISTLSTPGASLDTNANVGTAFIDNGQIYFYSNSAASKYSFVGSNVVIETAAPGGQIGFKSIITSYAKVPLTGTLGNAPTDLINFFRPLSAYINPNATFLPGATMYQRISTRMGDHLILRDGDNNNSTNPQSATPVATSSTIEQYAAAQPTQLTLSLGTIRSVKGARCWINNVSGQANATGALPFFPNSIPSYGVVCEVGGSLYGGNLIPDGSQNGQNYPSGQSSSQIARLAYQPRFNKAAYDSLKAAVP
jgi:hypothetical protein